MISPMSSDIYFHRTSPSKFCRHVGCLIVFEDDDDFREKLTHSYIKMFKVKMRPSISMAHVVALNKGPAIYPIRCVKCKIILQAGNLPVKKRKVFNGLVPKYFVFGSVDSEAFDDAWKKSTYNFQHFNVLSIKQQ